MEDKQLNQHESGREDAPSGLLSSRVSGILLHPTSLPGRYGIGDIGPQAQSFVDFLANSRQTIWQILPLNPAGSMNSPYAALSTFAGNPLLISIEALAEEGLLTNGEIQEVLPEGPVDYARAASLKMRLLRLAFERFGSHVHSELREYYETFCSREKWWLDDFALFATLRDTFQQAWTKWPTKLAERQAEAVDDVKNRLSLEIDFRRFLQMVFFRQWEDLHKYALERGIRIVGDLPIFVAADSVDVWTNPELFFLDETGNPTVVAGVPPDVFSDTGQRWGNPLYRWDELAESNHEWWIKRLRAVLGVVDAVRIDHFRGFQAYWEVPATHETAEFGKWVPGPGQSLFEMAERALGKLPIIVEDLGLITPDVLQLRDEMGYPGMKVLQFAFAGGPSNPYLPHNFDRNCVVYTATHDNDTTLSWYKKLAKDERASVLKYLGTNGRHIVWDMIRLALASVADIAIIPMQDLLSLGNEARMNYPGRAEGNWRFRLKTGDLTDAHGQRLANLTITYGRHAADDQRADRTT